MASTATREIVIAAPPERVFDVIADYRSYPEFVPAVRSCHARRHGTVVEVDFEVDLGVKRIHYTLRHEETRPRTVSWSLVASDWMKVSNGAWHLEPRPGDTTRALYTVEVQIAKPPLVPQKLVDKITEELTRVQLPRTLEAFKRRAEQA